MELYRRGIVNEEDIDNFIDKWHNNKGVERRSLHEYLGMSLEVYAKWVINPKTLK
jgi:hypothetical protein